MATLSEEETIIHERFLQLKAAALTLLEEDGGRLSDQRLVRLGYDCLLDCLDSIYKECSNSASLSKDKYVSRFLKKYKPVMDDFGKLRLKETDFITKGIIGQGHFGEVRVVEEKTTNQIYAMKIMKKTHILQQADATFFIEERDIMALGNSQWLTKLHYAFQDEKCLYLVMDYHPGGDLFTVMERKEMGMNEGEACFYTAEIICALHDLHKLGFVHRDVKPDNVLITRSGHIKLVDFGSASRLDENGKVVDYTLPVGTPEYISPEVLTSLDKKLTYGVSCDWWSVGIIMYELLFEVTPFEGSTTAETYANIMSFHTSLHIPEELSPEARNLIESLLVRPEKRLEYTDIVKHSFFEQVDWNNIASMAPPFIPVIKGPTDTSNFDSFDPIDDSTDTNAAHKSSRSFTGRNLPFIGFSYTNWSSYHSGGDTPHNIGINELDSCPSDVRVALKKCTDELRAANEEKRTAEQECAIYRKQMMDLHRKLESERKERGTSNTKALQLLAEVRENNKIAKEMRDSENKEMSVQVQSALVQLEQERVSAVKRCQRAHEELKKKQNELDCSTAKLSDLKSKLAHVRERSKIDTSHLQDKLQRFSDDSKKRIMQLHNEYAELQDRYTAVNKELKQLKELQIKQENATSSTRVSVTSSKELEELKIELEIQKQLTDQYNTKVLECEKEVSLKTVQCQEMEKSLDLEAALKQNLQEKYDTILKELKCYEEPEKEEGSKTTPTNSNNDDNISSLQEELFIQKQLTDEYNFKVLEYEKELGMKSVQCQEMTEALKLEQNLNNKLYDDIYHLRQEHGKLQAAHMKLSKQFKTQESRVAEASKETEQALQDKAVIEGALELERTRMQIQLAQFTKLIDYRHNTPNASKKKNNPKKGIKLSRKKRDPEKERSEWMILKDIAKNSKDNKGDSRVSRSPSVNSVLVDQATPGGQSVRSTRNNKQSVTPGTTSSLVSSSSVAPTPSKSGIKRSAPDSSAAAVLEHNIPHRWVIKSGAFHKSHSCSTCSGSIKHTQKYAKCAYCSYVVHQKCTSNTPNSCGLPIQLAAHLYPTSPSKRQCSQAVEEENKENASFVSSTSSMDKMRRLSIDLVRCNTSLMSTGTDLSITSSMLASNESNDDSLV